MACKVFTTDNKKWESHLLMKLFISFKFKSLRLIILAISSCFFTFAANTAQADFYKALDAYRKHDGLNVIKEVKDAVNKKNNEGLMLFMSAMSIDRGTSMKTSLYKGSPDNKQTTLKNILTDEQRQELIELLITATSNSNADAQLYLTPFIRELNNPQLTATLKSNDEYAKSGSLVAANYSKLTDIERAELGDPFAQMLLGLSYLRAVDYRKYGCDESPEKLICRPKDETKGYYWLKKSLKSYESKGHGEMGAFDNSMCDLLQNLDDPKQLKQAYLWCILGMKSGAQSDSFQLLEKMHRSGKLKTADPDVDNAWNSSSWEDRRRTFTTLGMIEQKELPSMLIETRKELTKDKLPVFTYYVNDYIEYELDVYADGRVNIAFGGTANGPRGSEGNASSFVDVRKDLLVKLPSRNVKSFLADLKKSGFYSWTAVNNDIGFCDNFDWTGCVPKRYQATLRDGVKVNRFYYAGLAGYMERKNDANTSLAMLANLVEKYFPTKGLRCELGASEEYKQACLVREAKLLEVAQPIPAKPKK